MDDKKPFTIEEALDENTNVTYWKLHRKLKGGDYINLDDNPEYPDCLYMRKTLVATVDGKRVPIKVFGGHCVRIPKKYKYVSIEYKLGTTVEQLHEQLEAFKHRPGLLLKGTTEDGKKEIYIKIPWVSGDPLDDMVREHLDEPIDTNPSLYEIQWCDEDIEDEK